MGALLMTELTLATTTMPVPPPAATRDDVIVALTSEMAKNRRRAALLEKPRSCTYCGQPKNAQRCTSCGA